jgi:hypothetical protein
MVLFLSLGDGGLSDELGQRDPKAMSIGVVGVDAVIRKKRISVLAGGTENLDLGGQDSHCEL